MANGKRMACSVVDYTNLTICKSRSFYFGYNSNSFHLAKVKALADSQVSNKF
jgi:hypothetical protein